MYDPKNPTVQPWNAPRKLGSKTIPRRTKAIQAQILQHERLSPVAVYENLSRPLLPLNR